MDFEAKPDYLTPGEGFVDITFSRPITISGAKTTTLRMREPLVRDQRAVTHIKDDEAKETALIVNLCEIDKADLEAMPLKEYLRVARAFSFFIG